MATELVPREPQEMDLAAAYALAKSSPGTVTNERNAKIRRSVVSKFLEWVKRPPEDVEPEDIEAWRSDMEARGLSKATQYQRVSILSQFFEYLVVKELVRYNPVPRGRWRNGFRPKPYESEKTKAMTAEQVEKFFAAIPTDTVVGKRLRAMCLVMLTTGMRAAEVCSVLWRNASLDSPTSPPGPGEARGGQPPFESGPSLRTQVKGGEWVTFELTEKAAEAIRDYLKAAKRRPRPNHALFTAIPKRKKRGRLDQPLSPFYLWDQIKRVAKKVGLEWIGAHTFRHTFAQLFHDSGGTIPEVQGLLGHKSEAVTRVYLQHLAPRSSKAGRAIQEMLDI